VTIAGQTLTISQASEGCGAGLTVTHSSPGYVAGGTVTISNQFLYPCNQTMLSLGCRPLLPAGWTLGTVSGDGAPEVQADYIVFVGSLASNPVRFGYTVIVPAGQSGLKTVTAQVDYQWNGMINPASVNASPNPLQMPELLYHTADYRGPFWQIDGTEVNRVLSYWRAAGYHRDASGADGFAPGPGDTNGLRHAADFRDSPWMIDGTEVNRVLSYWRAGGYHRDPAGVDGFAPGAP